MNQKKTGVVYCRVSSKEQVEGTSLEMQQRYCEEYAAREGVNILETFVESGESAKSANRTEFLKAIATCSDKKRPVDYFIVYKLDRFARNQDDHVMVRAKLKSFGTELKSVSEPISETPVGKAMEGMLSVFAEFDNNVRTERCTNGMKERVKQGVWVWPNPLGYYRPAGLKNIAPEPEVAPHIRLMFEEYSKGIYTYESLAVLMQQRGLKTRYGREASPQLMERLLKNPVYCGVIDVWGEKHEGSFEAIVSKDVFNACQSVRYGALRPVPRSLNNPKFPLRGIVACDSCHVKLTGSTSRGRNGSVYDYYHHYQQGCHRAKFIPKETFEQQFIELLDGITPDKRYEKLFKAIVVDIWQKNYLGLDQENAKIRKDIGNLETERQAIFDLHRSGKYSDDEFTEQKKLINERIQQKRNLIQEKAAEEFDMEKALDYCFHFVGNTSKEWVKADYSTKIRFQNLIFKDRLDFDGKTFGNKKLSSVYQVNQDFQTKNAPSYDDASNMVDPKLHSPNWLRLIRENIALIKIRNRQMKEVIERLPLPDRIAITL